MWVKLRYSNFEWVDMYKNTNTNNNNKEKHYILLQATIESVQVTESSEKNNDETMGNIEVINFNTITTKPIERCLLFLRK